MIAVRPRTEFVAERFSARGERGDGFVMRLFVVPAHYLRLGGSFGRDSHQVVTPTATIGIRGTDHEPFVLDADVDSADGVYRQGTYDKVNRGDNSRIRRKERRYRSGQGGFRQSFRQAAKDPGADDPALAGDSRSRARVLRSRAFDAELDAYSPDADAAGQKQLAQKKRGAEVTPHVPPRRPTNASLKPWPASGSPNSTLPSFDAILPRLSPFCHGCQRPSLRAESRRRQNDPRPQSAGDGG